MKKTMQYLLLGVFATSSYALNAQDVVEQNLSYINQQFAKYNQYGTSFQVDIARKEVTLLNNFGSIRTDLRKIEFRYDAESDWVGLYCLDASDECMEQVNNDGSRKSYSKYTMSLKDGSTTIAHVGTVVQKFAELRSFVVNGRAAIGTSRMGSPNTAEIEERLRYVNDQFAKYNQYQTSLAVDAAAREWVLKDEFGTYRAAFSKAEMRLDDNKRFVGLFCLGNEECITGSDGTPYRTYTLNMDEDGKLIAHINVVLEHFTAIRNLVLQGSSSPSIGIKPTHKPMITANLAYVNAMFAAYNGYQTSFEVDFNSGELLLRDEFGVLKAKLVEVDIRLDESKTILGVYCTRGNNCLGGVDSDGEVRTPYSEYTMGISDNGNLLPNIDEIIIKFVEIKKMASN